MGTALKFSTLNLTISNKMVFYPQKTFLDIPYWNGIVIIELA